MHFVDHGTGGGPEVLTPGTCATPTPKQCEVLVKVAFAGVNRPDCLQRSGRYPPPPGASSIVGLEVSGEVVAVGEGVSKWRVEKNQAGPTTGILGRNRTKNQIKRF